MAHISAARQRSYRLGTFVHTRHPARRAPAPKTETAKRLEYVRALSRLPSLRAFHAHLAKNWQKTDGSVSYEAVRNYHYDREPPAQYLARVAAVFGVPLTWLVTGEGQPTTAHDEAAAVSSGTVPLALDWQRERAGRLLHTILQFMCVPQLGGEDVPYWSSPNSHIPYWVAPLGELRLRLVLGGSYAVHDPLGMPDPRGDLPGNTYLDPMIEYDIARALKGPLEAFHVDAAQMEPDTLGDYITMMIPALLAIAAEQRKQQPDTLDDPKMRAHEVTAEEIEREHARKARRALRTKSKKPKSIRNPSRRGKS